MFAFAIFIVPSVISLGPDGGKFMQHMIDKTKFPTRIAIAALITLITGLLLMWELSNGFKLSWITGRYGMFLTIGGILAVVAFIIGLRVNMPATKTMSRLNKEVAAGGGPPSEEQMAMILATRAKIVGGTNSIAILLSICVLLMATARYVVML